MPKWINGGIGKEKLDFVCCRWSDDSSRTPFMGPWTRVSGLSELSSSRGSRMTVLELPSFESKISRAFGTREQKFWGYRSSRAPLVYFCPREPFRKSRYIYILNKKSNNLWLFALVSARFWRPFRRSRRVVGTQSSIPWRYVVCLSLWALFFKYPNNPDEGRQSLCLSTREVSGVLKEGLGNKAAITCILEKMIGI